MYGFEGILTHFKVKKIFGLYGHFGPLRGHTLRILIRAPLQIKALVGKKTEKIEAMMQLKAN